MTDAAQFDRLIAANRYLVLATADQDGHPWATPVFFAPLGPHGLCWVSSPTSRHSRNITARAQIAITVFDSTVEVGRADAAYCDAHAEAVFGLEADVGVRALNARLPKPKRLVGRDLQPAGSLAVYRADIHRRYVLARGGSPEYANQVDVTIEL